MKVYRRRAHSFIRNGIAFLRRENYARAPQKSGPQAPWKEWEREAAAAKGNLVGNALRSFEDSHGWQPVKNPDKSIAIGVRRDKNPFGFLVKEGRGSLNVDGTDYDVPDLKKVVGTYEDRDRNVRVVYTTQDGRTYDQGFASNKPGKPTRSEIENPPKFTLQYASPGEITLCSATRDKKSYVGVTKYNSLIFGPGTGDHGRRIDGMWEGKFKSLGQVVSVHSNVGEKGGNFAMIQENGEGKKTLTLINSWESNINGRPEILVREKQSLVVHPDIEDVAILVDNDQDWNMRTELLALTWRDGSVSKVSLEDLEWQGNLQGTLNKRDEEEKTKDRELAASRAVAEAHKRINESRNPTPDNGWPRL